MNKPQCTSYPKTRVAPGRRLNEVRSKRPEQSGLPAVGGESSDAAVSMKSGLRDRNNEWLTGYGETCWHLVSMKSGLRDRNNSNPSWRAMVNFLESQ